MGTLGFFELKNETLILAITGFCDIRDRHEINLCCVDINLTDFFDYFQVMDALYQSREKKNETDLVIDQLHDVFQFIAIKQKVSVFLCPF